MEGTGAIPVGADLSLVHHTLAYWLLGPKSPSATGNSHRLVSESVATIRELHLLAIRGDRPDQAAAWSAAESAESAWKAIANQTIEIFREAPLNDCEQCADSAALALEHITQQEMLTV